MRGFAKQVKRSKETLEQYLKDQNKLIKRSYQFPPEKTSVTYTGCTFSSGSTKSGSGFSALIPGEVQVDTTTERWFEGAFRYHVPGGSSALEKWTEFANQADVVLGVDLTPEVLWNLTPWTWMLDWFGNVGDVMTNISNLGHDGMVMQYGYLMEHKVVRQTYTGMNQGQRLQTVRTFESKRRMPASPYGFGLVSEDLTLTQQAILAALGASRAPGKIH